jgi:glycosyltransferase involved in cell wall biosynthesis
MNIAELGVIMTTYNRSQLLRATVESYNDSNVYPPKIHVFDDLSEGAEVIEIASKMINCQVHGDTTHRGVFLKTPLALEYMFVACEYDAVLILDSDTLFAPNWWVKALDAYNEIREMENVMTCSIFNFDGAAMDNLLTTNLIKKKINGAFGCIVKKEYWQRFILPLKDYPAGPYTNWDNVACENASAAGYTHLGTPESYLQHTGTHDGIHSGPTMKTFATDFVGKTSMNRPDAVDESVKNKKALVSCCGRNGDCINASFLVNFLISQGFDVSWVTIPGYAQLIEKISPESKIILFAENPDDTWAHFRTDDMRVRWPGFRYYINAQPGSPEHHNNLMGSGKSMALFVKEIFESITEVFIPDDYCKYRSLKPTTIPLIEGWDGVQPICLVSDTAISTKSALSREESLKIVDDLNFKGWHARIVTNLRPEGAHSYVRERFLWARKFWEFPYIMRYVKKFIGCDNGIAWTSFWCNGEKTIYHTAKRISETNNKFSILDSSFADIIRG